MIFSSLIRLFVGVLLCACAILTFGDSINNPKSGVAQSEVGFVLPNDRNSTANLMVAGVQVASLEATGCPSELARMLRLETNLIYDETCKLLLTLPGEELMVLNENNILRGVRPQACGQPRITLGPNDFVAVYEALTKSSSPRRGTREPPSPGQSDCRLTGQICHSSTESSFEVGCKDGFSVSFSTRKSVSLSIDSGIIKFSLTSP